MLQTVTLKWDLTDLIQSGLAATLSITPTAQMSDTTDHVLIPAVARTFTFGGGTGQLAGIVANDNANILPAYNPPSAPGAGYLISVTAANGQLIVPQFQTQLLYANGAVQWLDQLAIVPTVATAYQFLLQPSGTPSAGEVPVATGTGEASAWGTVTVPGTPAWLILALPALVFTSVTRNGSEAVTSASVLWPDGTAGTWTTDTLSTLFPGAVDAYHVTYGSPAVHTVTQAAVTRDAAGAVTAQPAITVT